MAGEFDGRYRLAVLRSAAADTVVPNMKDRLETLLVAVRDKIMFRLSGNGDVRRGIILASGFAKLPLDRFGVFWPLTPLCDEDSGTMFFDTKLVG